MEQGSTSLSTGNCNDSGDYTSQAKHKVFLSHSGAQKSFVEQLCVDLGRCDRHPFFDKRRDNLPVGEDFPRLIFEAIEQCEVGVVVLSEEFFTSKWPMLELVAMAHAEKMKPNFKILPIFLDISSSQYRDAAKRKKWLSLWHIWAKEDRRINVEDWAYALRLCGLINGLEYNPMLGLVKFQEVIVQAICMLVSPSTRFEGSYIQGRSRLCKVIHERIEQPKLSSQYGVHVIGLYGVVGIGKTTLCKAMCNDVLKEFHDVKVAYMELGSQSEEGLLKGVLWTLTDMNPDCLGAMNVDECRRHMMRRMKNVKMFLIIDNVSHATSKQALTLLQANYGLGSILLVTARSQNELMSLGIDASECIEMPELELEEAKSLFLYHVKCVPSSYSSNKDDHELISSCIQRCYFKKGDGTGNAYHPLALQTLGKQLGCVGYDPEQWWLQLHELEFSNPFGEPPVFSVWRRSFGAAIPQDQISVPEDQISISQDQISVPEDQISIPQDQISIPDVDSVTEPNQEKLGMLSRYFMGWDPHSSIHAPDISNTGQTVEPANTRNKQPYQPVSPGHMLPGSSNGALKFTMADLNIITGNFSESLTAGQGDRGSVYRGQLQDGTTVAVKRIKKDNPNVFEIEDAMNFQTEVDILSTVKHLNLVRLLGSFEDENEQILVTEYVTNGNLRQHLDGVPYGVILDMYKRCRISLDVLAAFKHLHNQTKDDLDIIHRDIKSSDILITDDFRAKVVGFGLSRRSPFGDVGALSNSTQVKKILEYMAPQHLTTHHLKEQNDVYLFGKLLVEIFTGKCPTESNLPSDECFTPRWVLKHSAEGKLMDIIDPKIPPTTFNMKILEQIFKLATFCLIPQESNCPTIEGLFWIFSFIVNLYFGDLHDESNSKGHECEVPDEQKWNFEACIEPNFNNTLCLEESKALKGQGPTKHLDKVDSSNPSFMPAKLHGSLFVESLESTQLGTHVEVDSEQATRQARELLVANQDRTSSLFIDIIPDVFQLKSDEAYLEMLQEEIAKLGYISRLLSPSDEFEQNLTNDGKTSFFLYFNEKDTMFEFYFKNYQGMASIVGVGLECAKVVLEDGWRLTIQEISKPMWDDAWKNLDSSLSSMKVTILEQLEEDMDDMEDSQEAHASIPRGQCLLLDLAQYFILKKAIASFFQGLQ